MASHIPATPINLGKIIIKIVINTKDLAVEIIADNLPFPTAVKYPDKNTFTPIYREIHFLPCAAFPSSFRCPF